jgi:hypothetical protein
MKKEFSYSALAKAIRKTLFRNLAKAFLFSIFCPPAKAGGNSF